MTTTTRGFTRRHHEAQVRAAAERPVGVPPSQHPFIERLESPLSTYYLLIGVIGVLLTIGLVMVFSASTVRSVAANLPPYALFVNQAKFAVIGLIVAAIAARMPITAWKKLALPMTIGAALLQTLVVFTPLGKEVLGNKNWLVLGPIQIQPSEFGKISLILFGALILTHKRRLIAQPMHALVPYVFPVTLGLVGLVLLGHDLGTSIVMVAVAAGVLWAAGVSWKIFAGGLLAAGVGLAGMVIISPNRIERLGAWLSCNNDVQRCWQSAHGQIALADGGISGLGLGGSREKWGWLPEPQNDFIYAIIGEELGIWGTLVILVLFALVALACYRVVLRTDDMFVRIATTGVMVWILVQAMINIASVLGLLPVIGVPLPLVSAGGSALITTLGALGMVVSFARNEPACRRALEARPSLLRRSRSIVAARAAKVGRR